MEEQIFTFYIEGKNESNIKFKTFTTVKLAKVILTMLCARGGGEGGGETCESDSNYNMCLGEGVLLGKKDKDDRRKS